MNRDVQLEILGGMPERLICRALEEGAEFAEVRRLGPRKITVCADAADAEIAMQLCMRYRLECRLVSRRGRSALAGRIRQRWTLLPGCGLCLLLVLLFLSRLWRIDVAFTGSAASLGGQRAILQCIDEAGLHPGMPLSQIDTALLEKQLMARCPGNSFIGVRLQGVRLLVEAAPEVPSPGLYDREAARDLVAVRDGVVVSVNVRSGTACVQPGDTVRAGQTLIRGEEDKSREETTSVAALGQVVARCWFEGEAQGALSEEMQLPTGRTEEACSLRLMELSLPLTRCAGFACEEVSTERMPVVGLFLPLEIERSMHIETKTQTRSRDAEALEAELSALARAEACAHISRGGIAAGKIGFWTDARREGNCLRVRAVAEVQADIAVSRDTFSMIQSKQIT